MTFSEFQQSKVYLKYIIRCHTKAEMSKKLLYHVSCKLTSVKQPEHVRSMMQHTHPAKFKPYTAEVEDLDTDDTLKPKQLTMDGDELMCDSQASIVAMSRKANPVKL
jgi:hypothetical protein